MIGDRVADISSGKSFNPTNHGSEIVVTKPYPIHGPFFLFHGQALSEPTLWSHIDYGIFITIS